MSGGSKHVLVEIDPGGLLLDVDSGALVGLNETATFVWRRRLAGGDVDSIAAALGERYRIPLGRALADTNAALSDTGDQPAAGEPHEFRYERSASGGYVLSRLGRPLVEVDRLGRSLAPLPLRDETVTDVANFLHSLAPKILSLRGATVLHCSAVSLDGCVFAFSGDSGAGKTTTARALVRSGAQPICEDKLVIRETSAKAEAVRDGERIIHEWARNVAADVHGGRSVSCDPLEQAGSGAVLPLREVGFLDSRRRSPGPLVATPLSPLETAGRLFRNSFHGAAGGDAWKRELDAVALVAGGVFSFELTMPNGLPGLEEACARVVARRSIRS